MKIRRLFNKKKTKKVLLRDRKRRTVRRVASARSPVKEGTSILRSCTPGESTSSPSILPDMTSDRTQVPLQAGPWV